MLRAYLDTADRDKDDGEREFSQACAVSIPRSRYLNS